MEITTPVDLDPAFHSCLQFTNEIRDLLNFEPIIRVRMGSGHDISGPGPKRNTGHLETDVEGGRSVIEARKNMRMNVNHGDLDNSAIQLSLLDKAGAGQL